MKFLKVSVIAVSLLIAFSCKENKDFQLNKTEITAPKNIKTEDVVYNIRGVNYKSFAAFPTDSDQPKSVVMVIPEWWGLNDYAKNRVKQLAELGYFAMAVDFYGEGKVVDNPEEAAKLAQPFYEIPINAKMVFDAAKQKVNNYPNADNSKIAVIGYCFGGAQALNMARQESDLKGAISFHGNLETGVRAKNNRVKILVCNGANDSFVPPEEIADFKKEMDSAKINYTFIDYPNAAHSFTNPSSTEVGKKFNLKIAYNKEADEKSWNDMKNFLNGIFK